MRKKLITILFLAVLTLFCALGAFALEAEETPAPTELPGSEPVEAAVESSSDAAPEATPTEVDPAEEAANINVTFLDADGKKLDKAKLKAGQTLSELPLSGGKPVLYWYCEEQDTYYTEEELLQLVISASLTLRDAGQKVTYLDSDKSTVLGVEYVKNGGVPQGLKDAGVTNWLDKDGKFIVLSKQSITADTSYTAWYTPGLNTAHIAYINGVTDTKFYPGNNLTRAQAATILYNLLSTKSRGPFTVSFSDVKDSDWFAEAVNTLASWGIITGQTSTTFGPKSNITRGDFVLMISRLFTLESGTWTYTDGKATDYFRDAVAVASAKGWITGYNDGSFKGRAYITRAEAVTVINRVLGRIPDTAAIDAMGHRIFLDVEPGFWAFYQIMEAATNDGYATRPIESLKPGLQTINGKTYYVDKTQTFVCFERGSQPIDGKRYFISSAGIVIPTHTPGLHDFSPKADGSELYLIQSDHSIRTEPDSGNVYPVFEYNKHMYCLHGDDGRLLSDESYGEGLYFNKNGAYTSGDSNLDSMVYQFLTQKNILNSSQNQERKLFAAYNALIAYADAYKLYANYETWSGQYCAQVFLQNARGSCAEFAWAMVFLAQRLGVDCQIEWGTLRSGASHVWELVYWPDGEVYLLDAEQEWGFYDGAGGRYSSGNYYDCYMIPYTPGKYLKYGDRFDNPITNVWSPYYPHDW